jgi:hypothetical protein
MSKLLALVLVGGLAAGAFAAEKGDKKAPASPEAAFKAKDKDGNGKLSKDEFVGKLDGDKKAAAEKRFASADKNGDGSLDATEFAAAMAGGKKKDKK